VDAYRTLQAIQAQIREHLVANPDIRLFSLRQNLNDAERGAVIRRCG
jgi:hypothetical protein